WLERPQRRPAGAEVHGAIEQWLRGLRGLAESMGEWAFYAAVILIAVALAKRIPYHVFARLHKWLALAYLVLVFHTVVLVRFEYWAQPVGWLVAASIAVGTVAAVLVLARRVGASRKVRGTIESLTWYPGLRVLESSIRLRPGWAGHDAGQFAFVRSRPDEGAHPYTIASAWDAGDRRIVFITKALGDHTGKLHERLKVGTPVVVEGPYGRFDFRGAHPRQIWIGAGIGITPFVARMKELGRSAGTQAIDLFHPTGDFDEAAIDKLTADARAANVRLHVLVSARDGRLDAGQIRAAVPQWRSASVWFCGPPAFGAALRRDFVAEGLAPDDFHQELFEMR
ncbi:MAG TPA: ferric reductase, partial [Quisquiliibacterium sp.]|nr:ferric reductase [Quisquiliibacterium sp.]